MRVNRDGLCIKKDSVVQVRGIDADDKIEEMGLVCAVKCHPLDKKQFDGGIWLDYLEPIPITPEILEKNGFNLQQSKGEYAPNIEGFSFDNCWVGDEFKWKTIPIKYVHELQHALKLCKIDKEIVV